MTRISKFKKNTIASLGYQALVFISGFILPRLFLTNYGSAVNGLVSSITNFLGFVSMLDLGIGAVVSSNLYRPLAEKDNVSISKIVRSAQKFYRIIALILIGYTTILMLLYPIIVQDSFSYVYSSSLILIISISSFAQYFFGITYTLLLKADQKQYISFGINSITLVLNTIGSIILINTGFSVHIVKLSTSLIFIIRPLILSLYVNKNYNLDYSLEVKNNEIKQRWNGVAQHLASLVQDKTDILILTLFTTLEHVSVYSIYYMIVSAILSIIYAATAGLSALFGNLIAENEIIKLKYIFDRCEWLIHTTSTLLFTVTGILIVPFIKVYTTGVYDANYVLPVFSIILCIAFAIRCIQLPYNMIVQAALHFKETQRSAIIEPIINILISILLVFKWGLVGVAIGTLVSILYRAIYLAHYLSKKIIQINITQFYKQLFVNILSCLIMVMSTFWIIIESYSYLGWFFMAVKVFLICVAICFLINIIFYRKLLFSSLRIFIVKQ